MEQTKVGIIYKEIVEAIKLLPLEQQAKLYNAIFEYQFTGEISDEDLFVKSFILSHKTNFDNLKTRREINTENGKKGGAKKGNQNARKEKSIDNYEEKQPKTTENEQKQPKTTENNQPTSENNLKQEQEQEQEVKTRSKKQEQEDITDKDKEKEIEKEKEADKPQVPKAPQPPEEKPKSKFVKPTKKEITDYALHNGLQTAAIGDFCDYYESNGWKVGRNPMKDWKAAFRRWCRTDYRNTNGSRKTNEFLEMLKQDSLEEQVINAEAI